MTTTLSPRTGPGPVGDLDLLGRVHPFTGSTREQRERLRPHLDRLRVRAGTALAHAGHTAHQVVVVVAGTVRFASVGATVDRAGPGTVIGATAVVTRSPHRHGVVAETDVEVLVVNGPAYRWIAPLIAPVAPGPVGGTGRRAAPRRPTPRRPLRGSRRSRTGW
jgi:hypothetical protein